MFIRSIEVPSNYDRILYIFILYYSNLRIFVCGHLIKSFILLTTWSQINACSKSTMTWKGDIVMWRSYFENGCWKNRMYMHATTNISLFARIKRSLWVELHFLEAGRATTSNGIINLIKFQHGDRKSTRLNSSHRR